jgi:hypothetical protein
MVHIVAIFMIMTCGFTPIGPEGAMAPTCEIKVCDNAAARDGAKDMARGMEKHGINVFIETMDCKSV